MVKNHRKLTIRMLEHDMSKLNRLNLLTRNTYKIHSHCAMALSSEEIVERIMAKAIDDIPASANPLKRYHVSQTADQLPDIRIRNALYRAELERQIAEKRELDRKRREYESEQEERLARKIEAEREKLRLEFLAENDRRKIQQDEIRRRQQAIAERLEQIREEEEKRRQEEANKRKRMYLDHLYNTHSQTNHSTALPHLTSYFRQRPWNSREYVHTALNLSLEEVYKSAPLHLLADVYKKLEYEKSKMKDIIRRRISEGEE